MAGNDCTIQQIYEKLGFRAWEGGADLEEEWESSNVLLQFGTMEMTGKDGVVLRAPITCRIEFGEHSLEIGNMKPTGIVV